MHNFTRKKLVVGNWKMHGNLARNASFIAEIKQTIPPSSDADFAICVPYPYLFQAQQLLQHSHIAWGAQNVSQYEEGAYTASVSASMIADFGCRYALLGHSERRAVTHETNISAARRFEYALRAGITPIYCIGETKEERDGGLPNVVVANQLRAILDLDDEVFRLARAHRAVIAYEPVWAIGAKVSASPVQAQSIHRFIRHMMAERDEAYAQEIRIIYGGSLSAESAAVLFSMPDIDGGLVGRASLSTNEFGLICSKCIALKQ